MSTIQLNEREGSARGAGHVLIIGGGIGGLCLAQGLRKAGLSVAVYERERITAAPDTERYSLQVNAAGNRALHACLPPELWDVYLTMAGQPVSGMRFVTEQLRPLLSVDWLPSHNAEDATVRVSRSKLRQILLAGLEDVVHLGKRFVGFELLPRDRVRAHFENGSAADGEVLVGADGVASNVRRQLLPRAHLKDLQIAAIGAKLPLERAVALGLSDLLTGMMTLVMPPRGGGMFVTQYVRQQHAVAAPPANPELATPDLEDHLFWALIAQRGRFGARGDLRRLSTAELRDHALTVTHPWSPAVRMLVSESDLPSFTTISLQTSLPVAAWRTGRVTLLGDAIHTMTPLQGLGGNTALRDAQLLCQKLVEVEREGRPLLPALGAYEAAMRHYGFEAVKVSLRYTEQFVSENVLARAAFKTALRVADLAPRLKASWFSPAADAA